MERLTKAELVNGFPVCYPNNCSGLPEFVTKGNPYRNIVERLKAYEDLEEQGELLKLPCAVGDTVYLVSFRKKCYKMGNTHLVNDDLECAFCENECVCKAKKEYFIEEIKATLPIIGNLIDTPDNFMVFLTRQEAEAKLEEMEGEK